MIKQSETAQSIPADETSKTPKPRQGWHQAFDGMDELGSEDRAWLDFGNEGDKDLSW